MVLYFLTLPEKQRLLLIVCRNIFYLTLKMLRLQTFYFIACVCIRISVIEWYSQDAILGLVTFYELHYNLIYKCELK